MASLPLANQVRQTYVATTLKSDTAPSVLGDIAVKGEAGKYLYFQHFGHGGLTSSDLIKVENIRSIKQTPAAKMNTKLHSHTVKVTEVSPGQVYEIKVLVHNYIGQGAQDYTYRFGLYKAKSSDTAATIAAGLKKDLELSVAKDNLFSVSVSGDTITITENADIPFELGRFFVGYMPLDITLNGIVTADEIETFEWATISKTAFSANDATKKVAELEYATLGSRGDVYRKMGWPRSIESKTMVDLSASYDVIDIHYFFQGQGVSSQKSEKEISLIVPAGNSTILAAINTITGTEKIVAPETYEEKQ